MLRGQYGARSTLQNPADPESSVIFCRADYGRLRLIGVLSVGKPNAAMAPVIKRSERRFLGQRHFVGDRTGDWRRHGLVDCNRSLARSLRYADCTSLTISPFLFPISVVASCVNLRRRWKVCA
ncbi:hypothetical protein ACVXHA_29090 [Escherichia coli]